MQTIYSVRSTLPPFLDFISITHFPSLLIPSFHLNIIKSLPT